MRTIARRNAFPEYTVLTSCGCQSYHTHRGRISMAGMVATLAGRCFCRHGTPLVVLLSRLWRLSPHYIHFAMAIAERQSVRLFVKPYFPCAGGR